MDNVILEIGLALLLIAFAVGLAHKLGLSNVPFLILVGMAVGPHAPQIGVFDFRFLETQSLIASWGEWVCFSCSSILALNPISLA